MKTHSPEYPEATVQNPPYRSELAFQPGQLLQHIKRATQMGVDTGALAPISTTHTTHIERGIPFQLRVLKQLQRKDAARAIQVANKECKRPVRNPFLPYETDLFVADITPSYVGVLNKFNVVPHHILLITRTFVPQTQTLQIDDMQAVAHCLCDLESLMFYNGGEAAGASQPHKHLQWLPLPLAEGPFATPLDTHIQALPNDRNVQSLPPFSFAHGIRRFSYSDVVNDMKEILYTAYTDLLRHFSMDPDAQSPIYPYNLIATRTWMMLVPRSQEFYGSISVNALGFVGGLLARTEHDRETIEQEGPLHILQRVSFSKKHDFTAPYLETTEQK